MMTVNDITDEMLAAIREQFDRDPQVCQLRTKQGLLQRQGQYMQALKIGKDISYLYTRVVDAYIEEVNKEAKSIHLDEAGIPQNDVDCLLECIVTMFMACDVIETAIMDADDIIHRTDKEMHFEMFNDLHKLAKMAKLKLQFMQENSGYGHDIVWADKCDNMYEMMRNKARSIIRKRKEEQQ